MAEDAIFQHPLAFLIGLEGLALLQGFGGLRDEAFTMARLAEVRGLLEAAEALGEGVTLRPVPCAEAYADWAPFYDLGAGSLIETEAPIVRRLIDALAPGVAVDVACGTGRHAAYLAGRGHEVTGVDASPEMLDLARAKVPGARFLAGELGALPLPDGHADLVVCGLALMHAPSLAPALAELNRVLAPGGTLIVSDWRASVDGAVFPLIKRAADGSPGYVPSWVRSTGEYIGAALSLGLEVRACEEAVAWSGGVADPADASGVAHPGELELEPGAPPDREELGRLIPEAVSAVRALRPHVLVCAFRRPAA